MDLQLTGKSCLITGASRGIGLGTSKIMAAEGCRVALVARRKHLLEELADEIANAGHYRPIVIEEDVTRQGALEQIRERVYHSFGGLDILVNNAGGSRPVEWNAPIDVWHEGMTLNFEMVRQLTNQFISGMRKQKYGRVINITGASEPTGVNVAITAKAAVHMWSKGLSRVVAADGVTVNNVPPGRINSEQILERLYSDPLERERFAKAEIPIGHFGEPEDMGHLIAFLSSPLARYITGEVIHVDGGMHRFPL